MELSSDSTKMTVVETLVTSENATVHMAQEEGLGLSQEDEGDMGDPYGTGSISPSLAEEALPRELRSECGAMETALQGVLKSLEQNDSIEDVAQHTSPLESISELDEDDGHADGGSELERGLGDWEVKAKEEPTEKLSPLPPGRKKSEAGEISGDLGARSAASTVQTLMPEGICDWQVQLNTSVADHSTCPHSTSANGFSETEFHQTPAGVGEESRSLSKSGIYEEKGGQNLMESCRVDMACMKEDSGLSVTLCKDVCDIQLQQESHQTEIKHMCFKLTDSDERLRELERDLSSAMKRNRSHAREIQQLEKMSNDSLSEVLTGYKSKVQQAEELKRSSIDLKSQNSDLNRHGRPSQLPVTQGTAAFLQRRILSLEEECRRRQHEVLELTRELEGVRQALREKSSEAAWVTTQLQALHQEAEGKWGRGTSGKKTPANGHVDVGQQAQFRQDSRVCVLL